MPKKMKRNKRGRSSRGVINDVPRNNTNIRVRFRKAITLTYTSGQSSLAVNPSISTLSKDLAVVYKLYRVTHLSLTFQAATSVSGIPVPPRYAVNYCPALEAPTSAPLFIEDYEGPAVGFWQNNRGTPYHWKIPSNVLNAMPYNWYETKSNSPDTSDLTQGYILSSTDVETETQTALLDVVFEFQTLEDPEFLARLGSINVQPTQLALRRVKHNPSPQKSQLDDTVYIPDGVSTSEGPTCTSRNARRY